VERIPVSTIVRTGAKVAAAFIGSSVLTVVVIVVVPSWLAAAYFGRVSGSAGAGLATGVIALALVAVCVWPLMGLYVFHLLSRIESRASLDVLGRLTLACVSSSVAAIVIFIPIVAGLDSERQTWLLGWLPLAFCAFWWMAALYLFRKLSPAPDSR
jgi:hypothetical protein